MRLREWQLVAIALAGVAAAAALTFLAAHLSEVWQPAPPLRLPGARYVALVRVEGAIAYKTSQLTLFGLTLDAEDVARLLDQAADDPMAGAVVLLVNSPGGSAAASEALYLKVRELASKKPVVTYVREYGASGAYMVALPSKAIIASNSSIVGSVGVYISILTYGDLLEKLGVRVHVFKSGELKDIGSSHREPTPQEVRVLEGMVEEIFELFKQRVLAHRSIRDPDEVFSGKPFTASQALGAGLIDGVGTLDDAIQLARELGGLPPDAPVRELEPPRPGLLQLLLGRLTSSKPVVPSIEIIAMWPPPSTQP